MPTGCPTTPSSQPSSMPSSTPTGSPTNPSSRPSSIPSSMPSSTPTTSPTMPSSQPTSMPSTEPSGQPSSQPTSMPSMEPSGQPSSQPTSMPSMEPSGQPSSQPTSMPSMKPSGQPSSQPTSMPSTKPSGQPSSTPTSTTLVSSPSYLPTEQTIPSFSPFLQLPPSFYPTLVSPSFSSSSPTLSLSLYLKKKLQYDLSFLLSSIIYYDMFIEGISLLGGCNLWLTNIGNNLSKKLISEKVKNIQLYIYNGNTKRNETLTCNDTLSSTLIIKSINNSTTKGDSIKCISTKEIWLSKKCNNGKTAFCVDCLDPCELEQCSDVKTVNPCGSIIGNDYGCDEKKSDLNVYRILSATFEPISLSPLIISKNVTMYKKAAVVNIVLSDVNGLSTDGIVYCGAFPNDVIPKSLLDITIQDFISLSKNGVVNILIDKLSPDSNYDIYCTTQSLLGSQMDYQNTLNTIMKIKTLCCKLLSINLSILSLYQDFGSMNAIQVTIDALPSKLMTLDLNINSVNNSNSRIEILSTSIIPEKTLFTTNMNKLFYLYSISSVSTASLGVHSISAILSGLSANEYDIIYTSAKNFTVLSIDAPPPIPKILHVRFSDDGTYIEVLFDSDTNKGETTSATFDCSNMFLFPGIESSSCSWESSFIIRIFFGASSTVLPGDYISIFSTIFSIKSYCFFEKKNCLNYLPMPDITLRILDPLIPIRPIIGITAPDLIGKCDSYILDLSSTLGGCGRTFNNITFTVSTSGNVSKARTAEIYLNNFYQLSPPTNIPSGTFPEGLNNIQIRLCNYFGVCSFASTQLTVLPNTVPIVTILGKSVLIVEPNMILTLFGEANIEICLNDDDNNNKKKNTLLYTWNVFENDIQLYDITSVSRQKNIFKLNPYTLVPNSVYMIRLSVFDSNSFLSSSKSVTVTVKNSGIVARIKDGNERTVKLGSTFFLDATLSYDLNSGT